MLDISEIDRQHKELVSKFNHLHEAVQRGEPREEVFRIIDEIISYTRMHFAVEEQLMREAGYPLLEAHLAKHRELVQDTLRLRDKLKHVGEQAFNEWLDHWPFARVLAHIEHADHQLEDHIFQGPDQDLPAQAGTGVKRP